MADPEAENKIFGICYLQANLPFVIAASQRITFQTLRRRDEKECAMRVFLTWIGRLAGVAGVLVVGLAVVARLYGHYRLGGFEVGTILQAGIASMLAGCLGYVAALAEGVRD